MFLKIKNLNPIIKILVFANVFIAFSALAQAALTYRLFSIPINSANMAYLLFIFLSTYLQYNMQRGYMINNENIHSERSLWLLKHKKLLMYSIGASLIAVMFLCNNLSWTSIGIMIGAEIVSTLYYLKPFNLRRHGYIKPFLISSVWVISCALVPLIENKLVTEQSIWFVASQFFFISVLCLLFDIKDGEGDYLAGVNTYVNKFGINISKLICFALGACSVICFFQFTNHIYFLVTLIIFMLFVIITILFTNEKRDALYYYLWIDGLLLLQPLFFLYS
jgi:4-hydroxybenzoate polyprenyltransferase